MKFMVNVNGANLGKFGLSKNKKEIEGFIKK